MRSISSIEQIALEKIAVKLLTTVLSLEDIASVTELPIKKITKLQVEEELLNQLISSNTIEHKQEQNSSIEQLESLSIDLLDCGKAENLSKWIRGENDEEYEAGLIVEEMIREEIGNKIAINMMMLKDKFSQEDIAKYANLSIERVNEIYGDYM
jgi:ethanolamine utilization protein EutQ (cupin superfamily)